METRATLRPGQRGTRKLLDQFGDRLVCVRYRYDLATGRRPTTVELIVETAPWQTTPPNRQPRARPEPASTTVAAVQIQYRESELRQRVKQAGGTWHPTEKLWYLPVSAIRALGLQDRIVISRGEG